MDESLADALPREIARVSAKRDRWRDMMRGHPGMLLGMGVAVTIMEAEIARAVKACASGDIAEMMQALQHLRDYDDDD